MANSAVTMVGTQDFERDEGEEEDGHHYGEFKLLVHH
jgi:hypothetical protein